MALLDHITIKGMVCARCVTVIKTGLEKLGFPVNSVSLGKVAFKSPIREMSLPEINDFLCQVGFEVLNDRQTQLIEHIKTIVKEFVTYDADDNNRVKFSSLLSEKLHSNYDSLSTLFSQSEGITLEKYIIQQRLERVKQLLLETGQSLTDIAYLTGYSSVHHLSAQFKTHFGYPPSHFRKNPQPIEVKYSIEGNIITLP